jgi:hypothetical protein
MTNKLQHILLIMKAIRECRQIAKELIIYIKRDLSTNKEAHIIHLNRYFYLFSGIGSKLKHRFDKNQLSSIYSLYGVDVEFNSPKCTGREPYKVLAKNLQGGENEIRKENPQVISESSLEMKQAIYESRAEKVIDDLNQKIWR